MQFSVTLCGPARLLGLMAQVDVQEMPAWVLNVVTVALTMVMVAQEGCMAIDNPAALTPIE